MTHRRRTALAAAAAALAWCVPAIAAQSAPAHPHPHAAPGTVVRRAPAADSAAAAFLAAAREGSARFRDRRQAISAGYRRIGPDFPGMGEHWISLSVLLTGELNPARPTFLSYTSVSGEPRLVGVAYAITLLGNEAAPTSPAGPDAWHDHSLSVEDEVLLTQAGIHPHGVAPTARLAMLHAWVWVENPAGSFAKENWTIPFLRAALALPAEDAPQAARALSLATHRAFYGSLLDRIPGLTSMERDDVRALIAEYATRVERLATARAGEALSRAELEQLATSWEELWDGAERSVRPEAAAALRALRGTRAER